MKDKEETVERGDLTPPSGLRLEPRRVAYKECPVAGWAHHVGEESWDELYVGAELVLLRDQRNRHDGNAVAVALADRLRDVESKSDAVIGYVPRTENATLAKMIDMGWGGAFAAELTRVEAEGSYAERLRMTIYIVENPDRPEPETGGLYAQLIDAKDMAALAEGLAMNGFKAYRWKVEPTWDYRLPETDDNVALVYIGDAEAIVYLMHLVAEGDKARAFLGIAGDGGIIAPWDYFVLTNVRGPVRLKASLLDFLKAEAPGRIQPNGKLSPEAKERLLTLIGE